MKYTKFRVSKDAKREKKRYSQFKDDFRGVWDHLDQSGQIILQEDGTEKCGNLYVTLHKIFIETLFLHTKCDHYFLSPGLAPFLIESGLSFKGKSREMLPETESFINEIGQKVCKPFFIHAPVGDLPESVACVPFCAPGNLQAFGDFAASPFMFAMDSKCSTATVHDNHGEDMGCIKVPQRFHFLQLILGFALYVDTFPEVIKEMKGNCNEVKHAVEYRGRKVFLGQTKMIKEEIQAAKTPHFRRGHWRLLNANYFVKKQGQAVYVRGTYVRGRAFEVRDDDKESAA